MKILWHSNASFCSTGYGNQTKLFVPRIKRLGHDVAISAFHGVRGTRLEYDGIPIYPGYLDGLGNDVIVPHAAHFFGGNPKDGVTITLMDIWVLKPEVVRDLNWACWIPIDHEPLTRDIKNVLKACPNVIPIAMSRFGERVLKDNGFFPLYAPHGVDTSIFKPRNQQEARKAIGFPDYVTEDTFIVGMVAANQGIAPPRKGHAMAMQAFKVFNERHPDSILYMHTEITGVKQGVNVLALREDLEIPKEKVVYCDQYTLTSGFATEYMVNAYNSLDVFLNPAFGEGFGIPILEAQACGIPGIVTNFSAMPQVCGSGWHVGGELAYTSQQSFQMQAHVDEIVDALEEAYQKARKPHMKQAARNHALSFDVETVLETYWKPILEELSFAFGKIELISE